jgi:hypothetical protein
MTGECNAKLYIGDNFGDGVATMRCSLPEGHEGLHTESFQRANPSDLEGPKGPVKVTWEHDERLTCEKHGLQLGDHCETCDNEFLAECEAEEAEAKKQATIDRYKANLQRGLEELEREHGTEHDDSGTTSEG